MRYIPSPIVPQFRVIFAATSNKSGRMQYHKITPGVSRLRISRAEFISAYNKSEIVAIRPIRSSGHADDFQIEFYI